jgi:hypothetical protein
MDKTKTGGSVMSKPSKDGQQFIQVTKRFLGRAREADQDTIIAAYFLTKELQSLKGRLAKLDSGAFRARLRKGKSGNRHEHYQLIEKGSRR